MTDLFQNPKPGKTLQDTIWADGVPHLKEAAIPEQQARAMIGRWIGKYDHHDVRFAITRSIHAGAGYPPAFINKILENRKKEKAPEPTDLDDQRLLGKLRFWENYCQTRVASGQRLKLLNELQSVARDRGLL